jgi:hypothetical protein
LALLDDIPPRKRITVGADKGYDVRSFAEALRVLVFTFALAAYNLVRIRNLSGAFA